MEAFELKAKDLHFSYINTGREKKGIKREGISVEGSERPFFIHKQKNKYFKKGSCLEREG